MLSGFAIARQGTVGGALAASAAARSSARLRRSLSNRIPPKKQATARSGTSNVRRVNCGRRMGLVVVSRFWRIEPYWLGISQIIRR